MTYLFITVDDRSDRPVHRPPQLAGSRCLPGDHLAAGDADGRSRPTFSSAPLPGLFGLELTTVGADTITLALYAWLTLCMPAAWLAKRVETTRFGKVLCASADLSGRIRTTAVRNYLRLLHQRIQGRRSGVGQNREAGKGDGMTEPAAGPPILGGQLVGPSRSPDMPDEATMTAEINADRRHERLLAPGRTDCRDRGGDCMSARLLWA